LRFADSDDERALHPEDVRRNASEIGAFNLRNPGAPMAISQAG
jgi:hypothetical protein